MRRLYLMSLKNTSICRRSLYTWARVDSVQEKGLVTKEILLPALKVKADDQARGLGILFLRLRTLETDARVGPDMFVFFMARAGLFVYGVVQIVFGFWLKKSC